MLSMPNLNNCRILTWFVCATAAILIPAFFLLSLLHHSPLDPVLVLHRPVSPPVSLRDRFQGSIPSNWSWAHRLTDKLFGARKPVNLNAAVFTVEQGSVTELAHLAGARSAPAPATGPVVWFLEAAAVKKLRAAIEADPTNQVFY